jgi:hypothetical protein
MENTPIQILDSNGENVNIEPQQPVERSFWDRLLGR